VRTAVWTFIEPRETSITPSDKIARMVAELAKAPLVWNKDWAGKWSAKKTNILFIVNGPFAFCKNLPDLAPAVRAAKRIIWVQNDYAIVPPKAESKGESPFRAAFRQRKEAGLPDMEFWTTIHEAVKGKRDHYVNWNAMAYTPIAKEPVDMASTLDRCAIYYGYYRDYRKESFDKYFKNGGAMMHVASPSKDFPLHYPDLTLLQPIKGPKWLWRLRQYGAGLYIEDKRQHTEYHSPATRFFEMLSAGVPIAFDEDCASTFEKFKDRGNYHVNIEPFIVCSRYELRTFIKHRIEIAKLQHKWHHDYVGNLETKVRQLMKRVLHE
jgi:hypothetical protein